MKNLDKVLQFQVWNECNNYCKFCVNKEIYNITTDEKIRNLKIILNKLESISDKEYNTVGLIGGEFFQGQLHNKHVKQLFFDVIKKLNLLVKQNFIQHIWLTATLISKNQFDLFECLNYIDDVSKVWICTSYDITGRFIYKDDFLSWQNNVFKLKSKYPLININTTSILTGSFVDAYINDKFSIKDFCAKYQTTWFGKPPNLPINCTLSKKEFNDNILNDFFPKRIEFLKFLNKFKQNETQYDYDNRLFSNTLRADALVQPNINDVSERAIMVRNKITNEEYQEIISNHDYLINANTAIKQIDNSQKCMHNSSYTPYVDSDKCFYCDKELLNL